MAGQPATYDLVLMLDSEASDEVRSKVLGDAQQAISGSGTLVGQHDWGRRRTPYEIRHRGEADYHLLQFQGPRELLESLQRSLRIADGVVRFRLIKLAPGTPAPPAGRPPDFSGASREGRGDGREGRSDRRPGPPRERSEASEPLAAEARAPEPAATPDADLPGAPDPDPAADTQAPAGGGAEAPAAPA